MRALLATLAFVSLACTGTIGEPRFSHARIDAATSADARAIEEPARVDPPDAGATADAAAAAADAFAEDAPAIPPAPEDSGITVHPDASEPEPPRDVCGDTQCTAGELCSTCPDDCGPCNAACGNAACEGIAGETCVSCAADCATRDLVCGNGECQPPETSASCLADCGPTPWPAQYAAWELEALELFNAERAAGTDCASGPKDPAPPLSMDAALQTAARLHSWDMSFAGYRGHPSCNGRHFTERAGAAGGWAFAENIAWGYASPDGVVRGWMGSQSGHCDAIMNPSYTFVGLGFAAESAGGRYTAMFR